MKVRKRPIVLEAEQLTEDTQIKTLVGNMNGSAGDWVITDKRGSKHYLCKDEDFERLYESANETHEFRWQFFKTSQIFRQFLDEVEFTDGARQDSQVSPDFYHDPVQQILVAKFWVKLPKDEDSTATKKD